MNPFKYINQIVVVCNPNVVLLSHLKKFCSRFFDLFSRIISFYFIDAVYIYTIHTFQKSIYNIYRENTSFWNTDICCDSHDMYNYYYLFSFHYFQRIFFFSFVDFDEQNKCERTKKNVLFVVEIHVYIHSVKKILSVCPSALKKKIF
jgi:hypothetical protein